MKYNKQLIFDYIAGNDFEEEKLEELENDESFMKEVIKLTRDKKLYHYCSNSLKTKYSFVKFLIEQFKDDTDFVVKIAESYINSNHVETVSEVELGIILSNLYDEKKEEKLIKYKIISNSIFSNRLQQITHFLNQDENEDIREEVGLGFAIMEMGCNQSKEIIDFFAKTLLNSLIYIEGLNLEDFVHYYFKTPDELERVGYVNFFINHINNVDPFLSEYLSNNLALLEDYKKVFNKIKNNWNQYIDRLNHNRVEMVYDEMCRYEDEHNIFVFDCREELVKIIKELGLEETFRKYPLTITYEDDFEIIEEDLIFRDDEAYPLVNISKREDIEKLAYINHMKKYLKTIFARDYIEPNFGNSYLTDEKEPINDTNDKSKVKIINYDFKAKKIISVTE